MVRPRVLVVDDAAPVRSQVEAVLVPAGCEVVTATCGEDALEILAENIPDLFVVDINMPGMGGVELIRAVRQTQGCLSTPIFVLTAESTPALVDECKSLGVTAWMIKPCNADALVRGVKRVLAM